MAKERLDKLISSQSMMTRSEASKLIKSGCVSVNGIQIKNTAFKADTEEDLIEVNGERFCYKKYIYIMMNKPEGIVSASRDPKEKTVIDIIPDSMKRPGLFPAGRLDKDTTGFVLITDILLLSLIPLSLLYQLQHIQINSKRLNSFKIG